MMLPQVEGVTEKGRIEENTWSGGCVEALSMI
jgi:hypothetical protein